MSTIKLLPKRLAEIYNIEQGQKGKSPIKIRYEIIEDIINENKYQKIAEMGCGAGLPTFYLLENCPSITEYIAVDPSPSMNNTHPTRKFYTEEFNKLNKGTYVNKTAHEASFLYPDRYFDLVYMDHLAHITKFLTAEPLKNRDLLIQEIEEWMKKVKVGGILCGHDYCPNSHVHVVRAVDKAIKGVELIPERQNNLFLVKI